MFIHVTRTGVNQYSLLALHGGSWSARGFGFLGLELTVPHYVEAGFVVFAPFYRLLGDDEGSVACHNALISNIVDDANAALDWVQTHAANYGASAKPVVFGQSAGAHLATSLAVDRADEVAAAVLLYPPTDFSDFALRIRNGRYTDEQGLGILQRVMNLADNQNIDAVDISASPIPENSFPLRITRDGLATPPVLMIHGLADDLVEARQSIRLCDALAGRQLLAVDAEPETQQALRSVVACGNESQMQLILQGQHALDVCLADANVATDLCRSGSAASRVEVAAAIDDAVNFALRNAMLSATTGDTAQTGGTSDTADGASSGRSGGMALWLCCVLLLVFLDRIGRVYSLRQCR